MYLVDLVSYTSYEMISACDSIKGLHMCQNRSLLFHKELAFEVLDALGGEVVTA